MGDGLLYIDLHMVHEVTSPQAFESLRLQGRPVRRPDRTLATADHNVPTDGATTAAQIRDVLSRKQVEALEQNCAEFGVPVHSIGSRLQGIVHVIGPELGVTQPGMTIVCGDSHTATHGAFGALAFGIGTSEVEHVLATQTLVQNRPRSMRINFEGEMGPGVTAKDLILATIGQMGVAGGTGHVIEFAGPVIESLSMEGRMTICNMTIEGGGRAGMIAPDQVTFDYLKDRPGAPQGADWDEAVEHWKTLEDRRRCKLRQGDHRGRVRHLAHGHVGHDPGAGGGRGRRGARAQDRPGAPSAGVHGARARHADGPDQPDRVFIGSCTNSRIGDLREAAGVVDGRQVADGVIAMVVPGSAQVKEQAEAEGLDEVFRAAGFDWRGAGCSMCLGMNPDVASPGERVASTSNRNFEGRQGKGARSHLMSPRMAAAAAIEGRFVDIRDWS